MRHFIIGSAVIVILLGLPAYLPAAELDYPSTPTVEASDTNHGVEVPDPYRWLEDHRSDEVLAWAHKQDALARSYFAALPERAAIHRRLGEIAAIAAPAVPVRYGERYFFTRVEPGQRQAVLYVQDGLDASPRRLIDPNPMSDDGSLGIVMSSPSPGGRYVAYILSPGGMWQEMRVRDVTTGKDLPEVLRGLHRLRLAFAWDPHERGFFYTRVDASDPDAAGDELRDFRVVHHRLGTPESEDRLVYERPDVPDLLIYQARVTRDGRTLVIRGRSGRGIEMGVFVKDLTRADAPVRELVGWDRAAYFYEGNAGDVLFLSTDLGAPNRKIVAVDLGHPEKPWKDLVPESENPIRNVVEVGERLLVTYLVDGEQRLEVFDFEGRHRGTIEAPDSGGGYGGLADQPENDVTFFSFASVADPGSVYRYDTKTGKTELYRRAEGLDWKPGDYETRLDFYESTDGSRIPIFVASRKGLRLDGSHAAHIAAFAAFGFNSRPGFSPFNMLWLERGGVLAWPQLRGGNTYGIEWVRAGRGVHKTNTIADFLAAAEWLIERGYTAPQRLTIKTSSGGGIISGAAVVKRPDLFAAALVDYSMSDLIRYERDDSGTSIPNEYGSPSERDVFEALLSYSPYHNVHADVDYPATLISCGEHDRSTPVWHSYKLLAALQAAQAAAAPVLMRMEWDGQHFPRGRENNNVWNAEQLAFLYAAIERSP